MWSDIFKLFWYAFLKEPPIGKEGGICCGPFVPDLRYDSIPDIRGQDVKPKITDTEIYPDGAFNE